jgi:hypothetical protein
MSSYSCQGGRLLDRADGGGGDGLSYRGEYSPFSTSPLISVLSLLFYGQKMSSAVTKTISRLLQANLKSTSENM